MKAIDAEAAGKPGLALAVADGSQGAVQYGEKGQGHIVGPEIGYRCSLQINTPENIHQVGGRSGVIICGEALSPLCHLCPICNQKDRIVHQIIRRLQTIHILKADGSLPRIRLLSLRRGTSFYVFIKTAHK